LANEPNNGGAGVPPKPQRAWRAACPGCGAPVDFASAASASAVCSFCRSTLLRDGEALRRIGVSAELFDDHSPLQLGTTGTLQGVRFTLVGRLQYRYAEGTWNEWHALFESTGKSAWLSEDNGAYVLSVDQAALTDAPKEDELQPGERQLVGGQAWSVASVQRASLIAGLGELPRPPRLKGEFTVADLRNEHGDVGTLDYAEPGVPQWSIGRAVALADLKLQGLREGAVEKTLSKQGFACPSCGAPLKPLLASSKAITCGQCHAVVDLSQGPGADLQHYAQNNSGADGAGPQIPLGTTGRLALGIEAELDWQVVGYQERCDEPAAGSDDEQSFWREYLLYHRTAGFAFLVDAEDGWSWVRPLTGVPGTRGDQANWQGVSYRKRYTYPAKSTWVLGEFYWQVRKDERALVSDFDGPGGAKLSREQTGKEVVWSAGQALDVKVVARAFGIQPGALAAMRRDASPLSGLAPSALSGSGGMGLSQGVIILIVVVIVMLMMTRCSDDTCKQERQAFGEASAEYQQCQRNHNSGGFHSSGGSFGGFSSGGGGHK
jgi:hypothetical protein